MGDIYAFLNPVNIDTLEVRVSERFKDKDGNVVPFVVRPVTQDENAALLKKHTKNDKRTGAQTIDRTAYTAALVASAVVSPDLTNAELQKHYGVIGEGALLQKMLYVGEFATLSEAVQQISGIDADINDEVDEAKNL